jgi:type I restriction enzyme S subunit
MENGKIALASGLANGIGFGSSEFHVVRPRSGIVPRYLMHYLLQKRFRNDARRKMSGTAGLLRVPSGFLEKADILIPPTAEQERIVAAIEEEFSRIEEGEAALESAARRVQRMHTAVVEAAVSGRLNADPLERSVGTQTLRPRSRDSFEPSFEIPKAWSWVRIASLDPDLLNGETSRGHAVGQPTTVLRLADIHDGVISLSRPRQLLMTDASRARYQLSDGDILVIRVNGSRDLVGRFILCDDDVDAIYCDHFIRMRLDPTRVFPAFMSLLGSSRVVRRQIERSFVSTAGQLTVNQGHIRSLVIPLPPVEEQKTIVSRVDQYLELIANLRRAVQINCARTSQIRRSILAAAFAGKLAAQDPSDEPASRLLERTATDPASSNGHKPVTTRHVPTKIT